MTAHDDGGPTGNSVGRQLFNAIIVLAVLLSAAYFIGSFRRDMSVSYRFICYRSNAKVFDGVLKQDSFMLQNKQLALCDSDSDDPEVCVAGQIISVDSCVYSTVIDGYDPSQLRGIRL